MALFGFGKKKQQENKTPEVVPVEKKEAPVIVPEESTDLAVAEEFFQKYKALVKEDNEEAFVYLQKAADLWHKSAVKNVIALYSRGFCIDFFRRPALKAAAKEWIDPEKAIAYGLEAEKHGVDVSWDMMIVYDNIEDYTQAIHWAKICDSRRDKPEAMEWLNKKSRELASEGMDRFKQNDYQQALALFEKAGELGLSGAQYNCALMYETGKGTAVNKEKALYWYEKAAEQGDAKAQFNCGVMYINGEGAERNIEKSLYWFEKAAQQGGAGAQYNCALIYDSKNSEEDKAKALYWYEKAAEQGEMKAQFICASRYYTGKGTDVNKEKSLYWGEKAAEQGNVDAQYNCGMMYNRGEGSAINYEKSLYWFEKAARQGNTKAQGECGIMYAKGEGTAVDKTKALYWLEKAVGSPDKWKSSGLIYEGYDARRDVHILGEKGYSKKAELKDWEVIIWDDSIPKGKSIKMETFFRSNMFIITLIAKA